MSMYNVTMMGDQFAQTKTYYDLVLEYVYKSIYYLRNRESGEIKN